MRESGFLLRRCIAAGYASPSLWKLKAAMTAKAAGVPYGQEPWDLGCSLYERLAFLKARHAGKGKG